MRAAQSRGLITTDDLLDLVIMFAVIYVAVLFPSVPSVGLAFVIGLWGGRQFTAREETRKIQRAVHPLPSPSLEGSGEGSS